jgi:thioredoxin-related protein
MKSACTIALLFLCAVSQHVYATENLKLNPHLDYDSDSPDGPLITGDNQEAGMAKGRTNYIIMFERGCLNSKRQARRTVSLYDKYKPRVNFVVIDLNKTLSKAQRNLVEKYFTGHIPHVVILDPKGKVLYNRSGEQSEEMLSAIIDKALDDRSAIH